MRAFAIEDIKVALRLLRLKGNIVFHFEITWPN